MLTSVFAPVGAAGATGVDDGTENGEADGLVSTGLDAEGTNSTSVAGDDGDDAGDGDGASGSDGDDGATNGSDESDGGDGTASESGNASDLDPVQTTSTSTQSCDLTVEDGESIQNAIDAAAPGDTICVETGVYQGELDIATDGLTLVGVGDTPTLSRSWGDNVGISVTAENVTIENFRVEHYDSHGIRLNGAHGAIVENVDVTNSPIGIEVGGADGVEIKDSSIDGNDVGVEVDIASDVQILNNEFEGSGSAIAAIDSEGIVVTDNLFDDVREHGAGTLVVDGSTDVSVDANSFENSRDGIDIVESTGVTVDANTFVDNWEGIEIADSTDVTLSNNVIADNERTTNPETPSVLVAESGGVTLDSNNISGGNFGVDVVLQNATNAQLVDNEFETGILLEGEILDHFVHTVDGNTVDGAALVYSAGETAPAVDESAGQHIFVDATDLVVEDHAFEGSAAPLQIAFSDDAEVRNNTVSGATIEEWGDAGALAIHASNGAIVEANTVSDNLDHGLSLSGSTDAIVRENVVTNNGEVGIYVADATGGTVTNNSATANGRDGIRVSGADATVVEDNDASENNVYGIRVVGGDDVEVVANDAADNGADGIRVVDATGVQVSENSLDGNDESGIHVLGSVGGTFAENEVTNNAAGIVLEGADGGVVEHNNVTGNSDFTQGDDVTDGNAIWIVDSNDVVVEANDAIDNDDGIVIDDSEAITVTTNTANDNGHTHFGTGFYVTNSVDVTLLDNTAIANSKHGIFVETSNGTIVENTTSSGQAVDLVLRESTNAEVRDNTFERGLFLDGDELDHYLHTIETTNTAGGAPIHYVSGAIDPAMPSNPGQVIFVDTTDLHVNGLEIDGTAVGVQVAYSDGAEFTDNTVTNSTYRSIRGFTMTQPGGIGVYESTDVVIQYNVVTDNDRNGLRVEHSDGVVVSDNTANDNGRHGISVEGSTDAEVSANDVNGNDVSNAGIGISVRGSPGTTVADNDLVANSDGISVWDSPGIVITENYVADGWQPITVRNSDSALVDSNVVEDGTGVSIRLLDSDGTALNNTVTGGTNHGIYTNQADVTIEENHIENAGASGIAINGNGDRSSYATLVNNTVTASEDHGIWVRNVLDGTTIHGNTVTDAGSNGIHFSSSNSWWITEDLDLHDNTISGAAGYGINLHRAEGVVEHNEITDNGDGGIRATHQANDVEIAWNTVTDNPSHGIVVDGADELSAHNNTASNNHADLFLDEATDTIAHDNTFQTGVLIEGDESHFEHEFNGSTVNGGPIKVFLGDDDHTFGADVGQLIVAFADDVDVGGVNVGDDLASIQITESGDVDVDDLSLADGLGLHVTNSGNVSVTESTVAGGTPAAIYVESSGSVTVTNTAVDPGLGSGIWLEDVGSVDVQQTDVTERDGTGIHVHTAETVLLHDISVLDGASTGVWIEDVDDATLTDGTISGNDGDGLVMRGVVAPLIEHVTVAGSGGDGVVFGEWGYNSVDGAQLTSVEIVDNDGVGLAISQSDDVHAENATIENNGVGIDISSASGFELTESAVRNNDGDGVYGVGLSNLVIADSVIADNAGHGLDLTQSGSGGGFLIESNTISNNEDGLSLDVDGGLSPAFSDVVVTENAIWNNPGTGIAVLEDLDESDDVLIVYNSISGNADGVTYVEDSCEGLYDGPCLDATNNWWGHESGPSGEGTGQGDSVGTAIDYEPFLDEDPVDAAPLDAHFDVAIDDTNSPVDASDDLVIDVTVTNAGGETGTQTIELEDFDGSTVDSQDVTLAEGDDETLTLTWSTTSADAGLDYVTVRSEDELITEQVAILTGETIEIGTCTTISMPGNYTLTGDLAGSNTCIQITASDVHFDGNGHTIQGVGVDDNESQYGIHVDGVDDVTVEDVTLDGWDTGLYFSGSDGVVTDVLVENGDTGAEFANAHDNEVTNLTVRYTESRALIVGGFSHSAASGNVFTNVTAYDTEQSAGSNPGSINLGWAASNNEFIGVSASDGVAGIRTASGSSSNTLVDVEAHDNDRYGLNLESSNGDTFDGVNVSGNGWHDIRVNGDWNSLSNVTASGEHGTAISLTSVSTDPPVRGNTFESVTVADTDEDAIGLSNAVYSEFTDVTYVDSDGRAVSISSNAENNEFTDVTVTGGTASAVYLAPSDNYDNTFTNVQVTGAQGGLSIFGDGTTVTNLTVEDVTGTGISVSGSAADSAVSGVSITNASTGVGMFGSPTNNQVSDVTVDGATVGLSIAGTDNTLSNVTVTDSETDVSVGSATDTAFESIVLGGTTFSFEAQDVVIDGTSTPETLPDERTPIGAFVNVTASGDVPHLAQLHVHYDAADVTGMDESTLEIWRLNESWSSPAEEAYVSGVNTTEQYVWAENVTEFSTFGAFSEGPVPVASVSNVDLSPDELVAGENVTITADVENVGGSDGNVTVALEVDDTTVDTVTVDLEQNETTGIEFTHTFDEPGEYDVSVGDFDAGTVDVLAPANVIVFGTSVDETVGLGETLTVDVDLLNDGDVDGEETLELFVEDGYGEQIGDGSVDSTTANVAAGSVTRGESLTWTPTEDVLDGATNATVSLSVNDVFVGEVTVTDEESDIQVIAASTSETEIVAGEDEFHVVGSIYQAGTDAGPETIELVATNTETGNETVLGSQEVELAPGFYHLGAINISNTIDQAGTYDLELGDRPAGTIEVEEAYSDIQVIAASASEDEIVAGEDEFSVIGSIYQSGTIGGSETIDLVAIDDDGEETVLGSQEVELEPGYYHLGAINITTTVDDPGTYDLELGDRPAGTIEVEEAYSDIQVIAASASETEIVAGEDEFHVVGSIYQAGTTGGPEEIELVANNTETDDEISLGTREVELAPGFYHLGAINISNTIDDPGTYDLELGDRPAGTIEVEEAYSDIQVIAASASEDEVVAGEDEFSVIGSIYQSGTIGGSETIDLVAVDDDGEETVLGSQEVELEPGYYHLGAINITTTVDDPGTYDLELGDRPAGTIEVEEAYSDIQVIAASASEDEIVAGEGEFSVIGSIYQSGTIGGSETIDLVAVDDDGEETVLGSQDVELEPGYYHLGAINITTTVDDAGTYDLELGDRPAGTIEVEEAYSDVQVVAASVSEMVLTEGEEFHVVGSIYQNGTVDDSQEIDLVATNNESGEEIHLGNQSVELEPGFYHLGGLNITTSIDDAGTYDLTLGDYDVGTVGVDESPSDIQVIAATVSEIEMLEGEEANVTGSIYQAGDSGTEEIDLVAIDQNSSEETHLGSQEVTLESGYYHLGAIEIDFQIDDPGTYDLELGGHGAGEIVVEEAYSEIDVIAASASEDEIVAGVDEFHVLGSIYQAGTIEGIEEIDLVATNTETGEEIVLGSQEVELAPGFYHLGGINISTTIDQAGTYDLELGDRDAGTIEVEEAYSDVQVIAASASEDEIVAGVDEFHVVGSIYQAGTIGGTEEIELVANNTETDDEISLGSQEVELASGFYHLGAINISTTIDQAGTYDLELGDRYAGTIEVEEAYSDIQVIAASASEDEIVDGEDEFHVVGSIYQAGTTGGTEEIELVANNTETDDEISLGSQEVELAPGFYHLGAINISNTIDDPGTYDLELGDRYAGTIEVLPATSDIQVIAASASEDEVVEGVGEFHVVGSIYQNGTIDGPEEIELVATNTETDEETVLGTREVELAPGFYHLGAINVSATIDEVGTYELELGERSVGELTVTAPTVEATIAGVEGASTGLDADADVDLVYASDEATVEVDVAADLDLESVTLQVSSQETSYTVLEPATESDLDALASGETWSASVPLDDLPDDGRYDLSVVAVDERGTFDTDAWDGALTIDRDDPSMSVSIEDVDDEDATIVVESDAPLVEPPTVDVEFTDPSTAQLDPVELEPTDGQNTTFEGTLEFGDSGEYEVTVTGTDRAGNVGEDTASVVIHTGFTLADGTIEIAETGTSIDFELVEDAAFTEEDLYVALSENAVDANLGGEELGVGFLTADLDGLVGHYLDEGTIEHATIELAVDEDALPAGATVDDVGLYHYDDGWNDVDSEIVYDGDDPFLTADVHGFSTYGALVLDEDAPVLTNVSPTDGDELDAGTDEVTVRFEYDDEQSGVDVGSIELEIDGTDVTTDDATSITSSWTEHVLTVEDGESYEATLTVADEAGNEATFETTFAVDEPAGIPEPPEDDDDDDGSDDGTDESDDDESDDAGDDEDSAVGDDDQSGTGADDGDEPPEHDDADDPADDGQQPPESDDADDDDGIPGFGPLVALFALVLALSAGLVIGRAKRGGAQPRR
ncbi:right-handed parallel beta-helix repeat-containing protein [Halovivax gelatinilyticus]|uniref:right-handed parallel beta-helix repeat-containing protein n=1 Tax=Halovivax gelatinilyticus TaxID=2961597 RepID=UPI0020CA9258|nr:right-handed parallel beta-helix repeat-containing protein [Halovivax gelatinilyticus]